MKINPKKLLWYAFILVPLAWLIWAMVFFFTYEVQFPEFAASTEPYQRLVVGCERHHAFVSDCARNLEAAHFAGWTFFKYEDCERGHMREVYPVKCWPFYDQEPYIQFTDEQMKVGQ